MDYLLREDRLSLTDLATQQGVSASTVWRWAMRGIRSKRLETFTIGGRRYTTAEAFARFITATQMGWSNVDGASCRQDISSTHREAEAYLGSEGV